VLISCYLIKQSGNEDVHDDWEDVEDQYPGLRCVDRWRNAGPEEQKKMFALFQESGIFIASCRHRIVLLACDMIKSGELYVAHQILVYIILIEMKCEVRTCNCRSANRCPRKQGRLCI
jgi:hypothetical protein